jgi:integrase
MAKRANGEGSKPRKKPNGRFEARATVDTPTGRRRVSFYGATAKEAADKRTAAVADRNRGALFTDPGRLTTGEYLERWLSDSARYQVAASTHGRYERTCKNHLIPFFGAVKLRDLSPPHVRAFKARKIEGGLNPNTIGVMQGVLSVALNQAVDDGLILQNPASRVRKAAMRGQAPMRALSQEEATRLLHAATGTRDEALVTLAIRTGMRQGELAALRWEDLDLGAKPTITVRRSADTRTKTVVSTTKTGQERRIGIGPRTVEVLERHRARQRHERMASKAWSDPGLVFPNTRGKVRRRDSVMRSLRALLEAAGLSADVRFHDLRHTAATLALKRGLPIQSVSKMLGHSNPAMTLKRYAHVLDDMREEAGRAMDELG